MGVTLPSIADAEDKKAEGMSLFGEPLYASVPSDAMVANYKQAKMAYEVNPDDAMALIWYGRRTAYLGEYGKAIDIFTTGIEKHPTDARMYRHRGHRYISIRKFDAAIADLEKAAELIKGTENAVEPDGMPNQYGIPLSTTHGNIWYHLGLAYYLNQDMENALRAYREGHAIAPNDDGTVSTAHWLYMILRRLGRDDEAAEVVKDIAEDMKILENMSYHQLCLLYNGTLERDALGEISADNPGNSAVAYGIANWYYYNGDQEKSDALLKAIMKGSSWAAFGYIAAEADLASR